MLAIRRGVILFSSIITLVAISGVTLAAPTYSHDIKPILHAQCAGCHFPAGPGPFSLLTYADARAHAHQIASVTQSRYMPPWPPAKTSGPFQDERHLTPLQIHLLSEWVQSGMPEGEPDDGTAPARVANVWRLGKPDLILRTAHAMRLPASGPDVFWNFVFHPPLDHGVYVSAIEIRPGKARLVHHANLLVDRAGVAARLEIAPGAGFGGMDLTLTRNPLDAVSHFLFWKPGSQPYEEPSGMSWRLNPGNLLILNAHLQPSGKAEEVAPEVALYFTSEKPRYFPIVLQLQDDQALNIPAGARDFVVCDDYWLPEDARLLAIYPHAHYLGTLLKGIATLPDGTKRELIRIPHWDLNWQSVYRYQQPVSLPKGTRIQMEFHYDNSAGNPRNPFHPPREIQSGNQATDEMGHLWLQLLPVGDGDHRRVFQEAMARHRIARDPRDAVAHLSLGAILLSRLRVQEAMPELRAAIRIDSRMPEAHDMLGAALQNTGQLREAIAEYHEALRIAPDYASAHYNLAQALLRIGDREDALREMQTVRRAFPDDARIAAEYDAMKQQVEH